jgi:hypothetical protein
MKNKKLPAILLAVLAMVAVLPILTLGAPGGTPPLSNISPTFSSINLSGSGAFLQFPTSPEPTKMTGPFGRFVGLTADKYDGKMGGYAAARALCTASYVGSHVCNANEITNSYEYGVSLPSAGKAWINNGPPSYVVHVSNDCFGWQTNLGSEASDTYHVDTSKYSVYGSMWSFDGKYSRISTCDQQFQVACCSN